MKYYTIELDSDEKQELLEKYMRFLQQFCTYYGMCNIIFKSDLTEAMVLLAKKYAFPESEIKSNGWMQKKEQCRLLKGKHLFSNPDFAMCKTDFNI